MGADAAQPVSVPDSGDTVPVALIGSDGQSRGTVFVPRDLLDLLPAGLRMVIRQQDTPPVANTTENGSLGGGAAQRIGSPIAIKLNVQEIATGNEVPMPDAIRLKQVFVSLPVLQTSATSAGTFTWLMEVQEDGQFLGYVRLDSVFDPATNSLVFNVPVSFLTGTLFLPVVLQPAWVSNFDPLVHIWSSPFKTAADFGSAGPQFTVFPALAPQVGQRILVFDPVTGGIGWIDVTGAGPSGPPSPPGPTAPRPPDPAAVGRC